MEETGIYPDTTVKMGLIKDLPPKTALKLLLNAVDGGRNSLDYRLIDGVIVIATRTKLSKLGLETRIYDVTDFSSPVG